MLCITNAKIFDGEKFYTNKNIYIINNKIKNISSKKPNQKYKILNAKNNIVCPGFIDIQVNGGGGVFFNETPTSNAVQKIMETHRKYGTTSILPTFITDEYSKLPNALNAITEVMQKKIPGILGIHLEGPYLNIEKKGIHPAEYIRTPTEQELNLLFNLKANIKLITLAPEVVPENVIKNLQQKKYIIFAGHTNATSVQMQHAFKNGVRGVTHLFNACSPFASREPGVVGATLLSKEAWCSIIADGVHVAFNSLKLAFSAKNIRKFILVSDAMSPVGTNVSTFLIGKNQIFVKNNCYVDLNGTLAGSSLTVYDAFLNILKNKLVSLEEALQMASTNAAQCLKIDGKHAKLKKGRILPEFDADLLILDSNNYKLQQVIQSGVLCNE
jgi:N-acetylglucosamine-6-phosphate deacetylase